MQLGGALSCFPRCALTVRPLMVLGEVSPPPDSDLHIILEWRSEWNYALKMLQKCLRHSLHSREQVERSRPGVLKCRSCVGPMRTGGRSRAGMQTNIFNSIKWEQAKT